MSEFDNTLKTLRGRLERGGKPEKRDLRAEFDKMAELLTNQEGNVTNDYGAVNTFLKGLTNDQQGEGADAQQREESPSIGYFQWLLRTIGNMLGLDPQDGMIRFVGILYWRRLFRRLRNGVMGTEDKQLGSDSQNEVLLSAVDSTLNYFEQLLKIREDILGLKNSPSDLKGQVETIIRKTMLLRAGEYTDVSANKVLEYLEDEFNKALGTKHRAVGILEKRSQEISADYSLHEPAAQSGEFAVHSRRGMYTGEGVGSLLWKLCLEKEGFEHVSFLDDGVKYNFLRKAATKEHGTIFVFNGAAFAEGSLPRSKPNVLQLDHFDRQKFLNQVSGLLHPPQDQKISFPVKISIPMISGAHFTSLRVEITNGPDGGLIPKFYYVDPLFPNPNDRPDRYDRVTQLAKQLKRTITGDASIQDVDISTVGPVVGGTAVQARQDKHHDYTSCGPFCVADTLAYVDSRGPPEEAYFPLPKGVSYEETINKLRVKYRGDLVEFLGAQRAEPANTPPQQVSAVIEEVGQNVVRSAAQPGASVSR